MEKQIKKIRTSAKIGLIGSAVIFIAVVLFHYLCHYRFYPNRYTLQFFTIMGSVLAVLVMVTALMVVRKQIPAIKLMDATPEERLKRYAERIATLNYTIFTVNIFLAVLIVLSNVFQMLMLAMVMTLMLVLVYPNMYRIKVDAGLDDQTMKQLFGDKYYSDEK